MKTIVQTAFGFVATCIVMPAFSDAPTTGEVQAESRSTKTREPDKGRELTLQEVIVSARRLGFAERWQDVPISIGVVSAQDIDRRGLVSSEDYLRSIPGVAQTTAATGQSITIRGIETNANTQNFSTGGATVATYFGETPTSATGTFQGNTAMDIKLVDIERVEVLRGPQGTAFGSASLGGAVRTIPILPKLDRIEAQVGVSYSATSGTGGDNNHVQGVINIPLIQEKLALRAVGYRYDESGFYRNIAGSDPLYQAQAAAAGLLGFAVDEEEANASRFAGGRIAALYQPTDALRITLNYLRQDIDLEGRQFANWGTYEQRLVQPAPEHTAGLSDGRSFRADQIDMANAVVEYDFGWANLLATYSSLESEVEVAEPASTSPSLPSAPATSLTSSAGVVAKQRGDISEIRLATKLEGPLNALIGVYADDLDDTYRSNFVWHGSSAMNPNRSVGTFLAAQSVEQKAAFAELSWKFLRGWTLTGGIRHYDYDRIYDETRSGPLFGLAGRTTIFPTRSISASGDSFRTNLSYKPTENALVYAGWSQGFRLGRPQAPVASAECDRNNDGILDGTSGITVASTGFIGSDEVDNYEIGAKFTLFDRRLVLDATVYRMDWSDVPIRVQAPLCTRNVFYSANAGQARSQGVELQAQIQATRALRVDIGGSYVNAELTKDAPGLPVPAFSGNRLPNSPEVNANLGLQYEFTIGGYPAYVRADQTYVGSFYSNLARTPFSGAGGYLKVDASARVTFRDHLDVGLFVRNLTNQDEFTFRSPANDQGGQFFGYRLRPRTIGLQLTYALD